MSTPIIKTEKLSKRYIIGHQAEKGDGLRHVIEKAVRSPARLFRRGAGTGGPTKEEFWALRDIDFDVEEGEVVGIIGRNGAGKSTLLKILSRITEPTKGRVRLYGRVASLLEVGTGFHPELTGRENIFLNGAVLGMGRLEIKRKFDEIVAFASIEKFLDTPVKRYSSGMYVRLAFAVAAHLEPEILIVDEVLAVGDAQFQKKCLDKMDDAGSSGRTVLFVSHNMQAVSRLCNRCIMLDHGKVLMDGPTHEVTNAYAGLGAKSASLREWTSLEEAPGDDVVKLRGVMIRDESGELCSQFDIRSPIRVELEYDIFEGGHVSLPHFHVNNEGGDLLFVSVDLDPNWRGRKRPPGRYRSVAWIPGNMLVEGSFSIAASYLTLDPQVARFHERDVATFRVTDPLTVNDTARGDYPAHMPGLMRPELRWETELESESAADPAAAR
jgi:lipopolysaccharide transport system ATP-binding protein